MKHGETVVYYNPKYFPFRALKERNERDDAKLWEGKPSYQELMAAKIAETNKAKKGC